jgi:hypothetical protein
VRAVVFLSWLAFAAGMATGASVLPKYGVSVSLQGEPAELNAVRDCGAKDRTVMLPPIAARLGVAESDAERRAAIARLAAALPPGDEVFVRLRLDLSGLAKVGPQEKVIVAQVSDVSSRLPLTASGVRGLLIEIEGDLPAADLVQFALAQLTVKAKAAKPSLRVVFSFPAGFVQAHGDLISRLGVYTDALGTVFAPGWETEMNKIAELALNKPVFLKVEGELAPDQVASRYLDAVSAASGTSVEVVWLEQPGAAAIAPVCTAGNFLAGVLTKDFTPMAPALAPFSISVASGTAGPQKLFADGRTPNVAMLAKPGGSPANPVTIDMRGGAGEQFEMEWYDPATGARLTPGAASRSASGIGQSCIAQSDYVFLLMRKATAPGQRVYAGVEVSEKMELTADEVIARWQQYKEAQREALANYTAVCLMSIHFEPSALGSGFDVSMRFKQFSKRDAPTEWDQTAFYVNGVRFRKRTEFPLPQLEPEKVLTQPLELKLNEKYTYRLLGNDTVDGVPSYVLAVEPIERTENLYSGKIWIDSKTFRQVRMQLSQRSATSNVRSNEETQNFELVRDAQGHEFNLLKSTYAQQTVTAAGRALILEKTYAFSDYAINTANFDAELAAAHQSDNAMYRDTEAGLRALRKKSGERIEQPAGQKRVRSIVGGVLYEGTFNFPIPLLGYSLVDFDFRHTGTQFSMFWAGPIFAANLSKQKGEKFGISVDLVGNGLPSENRVYSGDTEVPSEGIWKWTQSVGLRATWQPSKSLTLTAAAYMDYNIYRATSDTDKSFVVPAHGPEVGPWLEIKWAKKGYILLLTGTQIRRVGWREFGLPGNTERIEHFYTKYSGEFTKNLYWGKFQKSSLDLAYYSGEHLDRFSRYMPSFFSKPRVRGIPGGVDTFDTIAVAGISHGFNIADFIKLEGSYNHAWAKNRAQSQSFRGYDGLEFDLGTAGPWGTYMQGIFTYALKGDLQRYDRRFGVYLLIFKPFH